MHKFLSSHFAVRSIIQCLFEDSKLTEIHLILTPQKHTKIIAHFDLSQHFVHISLILVFPCHFFYSIDSANILIEGLISDIVIISS